MHRFRKFLFSADRPLWQYCLSAVPLALIPSLAIGTTAEWFIGLMGIQLASNQPTHQGTFQDVFVSAAIDPAIETVFLAFGVFVLSRLSDRTFFVAGASAFLWASLHGAFSVLWFFGVIWSFFVYSCAYLAWRERSFTHGYIAAAVPHGLVNLVMMVAIITQKRG
jgi:hypothetical protein